MNRERIRFWYNRFKFNLKYLSLPKREINYYHFPKGRMISWSKSTYSNTYPEHFVVFNAKIYNLFGRLIWSGDLDLTRDLADLLRMNKTHNVMYITYEFSSPKEYIILLFFGFIKFSKTYQQYLSVVNKYFLDKLDAELASKRFDEYLDVRIKKRKNVQTHRKPGNRRNKTSVPKKIKKSTVKK